ncbi:LOW QUALITY PROTEIN: putative POM121-like protein 1-like [Aotus nancymaae]|uniref:LOW QUALITY PROTEIN: putative POM121-like protein 1-like n=1 Tax=Aotus nancymaae TaxID=37293 RepID=UPI0030FF1411
MALSSLRWSPAHQILRQPLQGAHPPPVPCLPSRRWRRVTATLTFTHPPRGGAMTQGSPSCLGVQRRLLLAGYREEGESEQDVRYLFRAPGPDPHFPALASKCLVRVSCHANPLRFRALYARLSLQYLVRAPLPTPPPIPQLPYLMRAPPLPLPSGALRANLAGQTVKVWRPLCARLSFQYLSGTLSTPAPSPATIARRCLALILCPPTPHCQRVPGAHTLSRESCTGAGSHRFGAHNTQLCPTFLPEKIMSRALKVSGTGMPVQDKDPRAQEKPDDQKGGPEGTRDARSAFRPLRDNGGLSPFVPRPGPLHRDLHTQRSEIPSDKKYQPSGMSCCTQRNAISSSYSSTGGFPWLKRRKGPASSHCQLPLTSSKTVSEVSPPAVSRGQTQCEKAADSAPGEKPAPRSGSQTSQASRPPRRKFPLLPRRQGEPLMLSPPLQLGFRVTAEDLDLEKKVALLCIDSALRGEAKGIFECRASLLSHALASPATGTSSLPSVPKAPSRDAQQERCKSQDRRDPVALLPSAAGSPSRPPVSGRKRKSAGPLVSSSDPLPATSAHSRDSAQVTSLIPARFPAASSTLKRARPSSDLAASAAAQASSSAPRQPAQGPSTASGKDTTTLAGQRPAQGPSTASGKDTTTLAGQRVSGPSPGLKLPITAAATTQPKPVVLHGQQQGTRGLKRARSSSDLAASAAAQASSSAPRQPAQGPSTASGKDTTTLAGQRKVGPGCRPGWDPTSPNFYLSP